MQAGRQAGRRADGCVPAQVIIGLCEASARLGMVCARWAYGATTGHGATAGHMVQQRPCMIWIIMYGRCVFLVEIYI